MVNSSSCIVVNNRSKRDTIQYPGGGGGVGVFVAGKLFISTGLGGAQKISHFITCLYIEEFWK